MLNMYVPNVYNCTEYLANYFAFYFILLATISLLYNISTNDMKNVQSG